jgi:hypothetical protein
MIAHAYNKGSRTATVPDIPGDLKIL